VTGAAHSTRPFDLESSETAELWRSAVAALTTYTDDIGSLPVAGDFPARAIARELAHLDPSAPLSPRAALEWLTRCMRDYQLHTAHPGYFGLFVPAPAPIAVLADALVAGFNPQVASASHAPFAVQAEQWVIRVLGQRLGFPEHDIEGSITSGGSEANLTALLAALHTAHPDIATRGLAATRRRPVFYVSAEAHHSWRKAARVSGLGDEALRTVPCDAKRRMDPRALASLVRGDRDSGCEPFLIVATIGTTALGAVDPLHRLRAIGNAEQLWLHADAAWAGAFALSESHRVELGDLSAADSVTIDPHKGLSVPMGAGIYLSRRRGCLRRVFATDPLYLPPAGAADLVPEPFQESIQCSRRFAGLKILMLLITAGWSGVSCALDDTWDRGRELRQRLKRNHWRIVNHSPLPLVCFRDSSTRSVDPHHHAAIVSWLNARGRCWVSAVRTSDGRDAIRACVCNYRSGLREIEQLIEELTVARFVAQRATNVDASAAK
jgi:glutamate/tyrosine decarboxylase-like PLP-dependent enzyme